MKVLMRHGTLTLPVDVDPTLDGLHLRGVASILTGVPQDRLKMMYRGRILRDEVRLETISLHENQMITIIGSAAAVPVAPALPDIFVGSATANASESPFEPSGLVNLGQTCYLNSGLQLMKSIAQLTHALADDLPSRTPEERFSVSLKSLFSEMQSSDSPVAPYLPLAHLRQLFPQFMERDASGFFSQQDAEEAWTHMMSALRLGLPSQPGGSSLIDQLLCVHLETSTLGENAARQEAVLKLDCNISVKTNYLLEGMKNSLVQEIEKRDENGRMQKYTQSSRISRLPPYLVVQMVRFYWRRDIQSKAKIMRKVKFPLQLDVLDLTTERLHKSIQPINTATKRILQARAERAAPVSDSYSSYSEKEKETRCGEREELRRLISHPEQEVLGDVISGIYELCGLITHKGSTADSGHYIGWTKGKDAERSGPLSGLWYKFDDDKVSAIGSEKLLNLDGGGEDSAAYILLYRASQVR